MWRFSSCVSYTRWCNDVVKPLVGDVVGVTWVLQVLLRELERKGRRLYSKNSGLSLS